MIHPLDRKVLQLATREQAEELVLIKIDEIVAEQNRLEQLMNFLAEVAERHEGEGNGTPDQH